MGIVIQQLWAKQGVLNFPDGTEVPFWGFARTFSAAPQLPGPAIEAKVGDTITIILNNRLKQVTSLVFPGQEYLPSPVKKSGIFQSYNTQVNPNGSVTYKFTATRPGIFLYESGTNPEVQIPMGLYGTIIVHPQNVNKPTHPDYHTAYGANSRSNYSVEKIMVFSEIDSYFQSSVAAGKEYSLLDYEPNYWLINGRSYPHTLLPDKASNLPSQQTGSLVNATTGQNILLRCINAGIQNHNIRLEGITSRVIAVDSWPLIINIGAVDKTYLKNTFTIASGESYDIIFRAETAGSYYLHDRDLHHMGNEDIFPGGMTTRITIRGWR